MAEARKYGHVLTEAERKAVTEQEKAARQSGEDISLDKSSVAPSYGARALHAIRDAFKKLVE